LAELSCNQSSISNIKSAFRRTLEIASFAQLQDFLPAPKRQILLRIR
jgi:hypothetical protein